MFGSRMDAKQMLATGMANRIFPFATFFYCVGFGCFLLVVVYLLSSFARSVLPSRVLASFLNSEAASFLNSEAFKKDANYLSLSLGLRKLFEIVRSSSAESRWRAPGPVQVRPRNLQINGKRDDVCPKR